MHDQQNNTKIHSVNQFLKNMDAYMKDVNIHLVKQSQQNIIMKQN